LLNLTDRVPFFFYLIFRERRDKGCWRLRDKAATGFPHRYTELPLRPLSPASSRQLLSRLLPGARFTSRTQQEILDKAAGNPYYLEEVVRSLMASGAVIPDPAEPGQWQVTHKIEQIAVPDSLEGMVVARLDRLAEDVRQALQMAAVIGRLFQIGLLRKLAASEASLDLWLAELERSGLIKLVENGKGSGGTAGATPPPRKKRSAAVTRLLDTISDKPAEPAADSDPTYTFPDALVQEVAYESLLVQRRQEFHRRVGEELEVVFAHRLEQESELLAFHFCQSDNLEKAVRYLEMAAGRAQASFANETALRHYNRLLELFGEGEENWQKRFGVLARRQQLHGLLGQQELRRADLETMLALAENQQDDNRRADALNGLAELYQWTGRYVESDETARQALTLKEQLADPAGQAAALQQMGVVAYYRGDYNQARPILEQAVTLRHQLQDAEGTGWSELYLCMIDFVQGNYGAALGHNDRALASAESRQDWLQMGIHLNNEARILHRLGEYQPALGRFERSLEMRGRVGDRTGQGFTLFGIGLVHTYLGHFDQAEGAFRQSLELRQAIKDERGVRYCLNGLGLVELGRGNAAEAESFFQQAYDLSEQLGLKGEAITDLSFLGQARLALGNVAGAAEASDAAIARLAEHKNVEDVQQIYLNHYRVLKAQDDPAAGEALKQAQTAMLAQAEQISDRVKRQGFLEKVKVNQEITAALALAETAGELIAT
jgi:tetratricopeptide (TPR) repeat protein